MGSIAAALITSSGFDSIIITTTIIIILFVYSSSTYIERGGWLWHSVLSPFFTVDCCGTMSPAPARYIPPVHHRSFTIMQVFCISYIIFIYFICSIYAPVRYIQHFGGNTL